MAVPFDCAEVGFGVGLRAVAATNSNSKSSQGCEQVPQRLRAAVAERHFDPALRGVP
jgi:tRNA U34 5-methylaminomethyl-2-thiouridine-forming methyltransferase MnmC